MVSSRYYVTPSIVKTILAGYRRAVTAARLHELIQRLANVLRAEERLIGKTHGLQPVQLQVLAYLAEANRYSNSPSAAAEYFGLSKGSMSQTLGVLQDKALIEVEHDASDGRRSHLELTRLGREIAARLPVAALREACAPPAAFAGLADGLEQLLRVVQRQRGGRSFGVCKTCRHFGVVGTGAMCKLTGEPLVREQTEKICREHDLAAPA